MEAMKNLLCNTTSYTDCVDGIKKEDAKKYVVIRHVIMFSKIQDIGNKEQYKDDEDVLYIDTSGKHAKYIVRTFRNQTPVCAHEVKCSDNIM